MSYNEPNIALAKKLNILAYILTVVVLGLVGLMRRVKIDTDIDFTFIPPIIAILNTGAAIMLLVALYFIKNKNVKAHRNSIYIAMTLSFLFLVCYVLYHFTTPETLYCKEGLSRTIYFIILITHIILAAATFPFILFTFIRGYTGQVERHRKMAKWVYPFWLYVAVTGPVLYLMLSPCYK
jgi:putative membrane protein